VVVDLPDHIRFFGSLKDEEATVLDPAATQDETP